MYKLTCPHCRYALKSPFVRVGAVMQCHSCMQKYTIKPHHVMREGEPPRIDADHPLLQYVLEPFVPMALGTLQETTPPAAAAPHHPGAADGPDGTWAGGPAITEHPEGQAIAPDDTAMGMSPPGGADEPSTIDSPAPHELRQPPPGAVEQPADLAGEYGGAWDAPTPLAPADGAPVEVAGTGHSPATEQPIEALPLEAHTPDYPQEDGDPPGHVEHVAPAVAMVDAGRGGVHDGEAIRGDFDEEPTYASPRRRASPKRGLSTAAIAGAAVVGLIAVVVVLVIAFSGGESGGNGKGDEDGKKGGASAKNDGDGKTKNGKSKGGKGKKGAGALAAVLTPQAIRDEPWQAADVQFAGDGDLRGFAVVREELLDGEDGKQTYRVRLTNQAKRHLSEVSATLRLVNLDQRVYATRRFALGLVPADKDVVIDTFVPQESLQNLVLVNWSVQAAGLDEGAGMPASIPPLKATKDATGAKPILRVSGRNPGKRPLSRLYLLLRGVGADGATVGRWQVTHKDMLPARKEFALGLSLPEDVLERVDHWQVVAAATYAVKQRAAGVFPPLPSVPVKSPREPREIAAGKPRLPRDRSIHQSSKTRHANGA